MADEIVKQIFKTTEYGKFNQYENNRTVITSHIKRLIASICKEDVGDSFPIVVGPNFEIYDGQHRFEARKKLNLPIYYTFGKPMSARTLGTVNASVLKWRLDDFVKLYSGQGISDYINVLSDCNTYKVTTQGLFRGTSFWSPIFHKLIASGEFVYTSSMRLEVMAFHSHRQKLKNCLDFNSIRFIRALGLLFKTSNYRKETMEHQASRYIEVYTPSVTYNGAVDSLLHLYNYNAKNRPVITRSDIGMR